MNEHDEFRVYLEGASVGSATEGSVESQPIASDQLYIEVPPPLPPTISKAPTGLAPMERIALEGQAYRGLSSGRSPWWVIIGGWVFLGLPGLVFAFFAVISGDLVLLLALGFPVVLFVILWRGTQAKLAAQRENRQRQARRKMAMKDEDRF